MHFLALIYGLTLVAILGAGVKSPHLGWPSALVAVFLLLWSVLIVTAQILSPFAAINVTSAYVGLSIGVAAAMSIGLRFIAPEASPALPELPSTLSPRLARYFAWLLAASAIFVLAGNLILAYGLLPANPDSIVYRFPRAYWYFGQGSLMHFTNNAEPRPLYYPFNGTLAYLPLVHFQLGPRSFSGQSLLSWLVIALTTYLFARDLGGSRLTAAATAWLISLTPNVLVQALSTNDDIIAAAPMLAGIYFVHRWFHGRQLFDALMGVIGVSISAGTKLHVVFYWLFLIGVAAMIAVHHRAALVEMRAWRNTRALAALAVMVLTVAVFSFSFVAYNYASAGRATAWEFNDQVLNKPFSLHVALQNIALYTSQIVLTPIADLHVVFDMKGRGHYYEAFNRVFAPLFTWVDNGPAFTSTFYRFTGVNSPSAAVFNELTLFIGFTWLVAMISGAWLFKRWKDPRATWARFHLASLPAWFVTYAAMDRYIEGATVYLCSATIVVAPTLVYAFAPIDRPRVNQLRWGLLGFVVATHFFFALSILLSSSPRNLIVLMRAPTWPVSRGFAVDWSVEDEVALARAGVYSHAIAWGQPHWVFMAYHPEIRQFLARVPNPIPVPPGVPDDPASVTLRYSRYVLMPQSGERFLHVFSFPQFPAYGHAVPVRIPDKPSPGLTWIGNLRFSLGPEWVFGAGNGVESRHPGRDKYIVITFQEVSDFGRNAQPLIRIPPILYGLGEADELEFRFDMTIDGKIVARTDWQPTPQAELDTTGLKGDNGVMTVYVRNRNVGGRVYSTDVIVGSTTPVRLNSD